MLYNALVLDLDVLRLRVRSSGAEAVLLKEPGSHPCPPCSQLNNRANSISLEHFSWQSDDWETVPTDLALRATDVSLFFFRPSRAQL